MKGYTIVCPQTRRPRVPETYAPYEP